MGQGDGRGVLGAAEGIAVEQALDQTTGSPSSQAAVDGGSFLGIPYGWPLGLAIVLLILVMWIGREPMHRIVRQTFFFLGYMFMRWGTSLLEHGRNARAVTNEKIASHRADELQDRMLHLEEKMGKRTEQLARETDPILKKLDKATHELATSANAISDINLEDAAERAFRAALPSMESSRGLTKVEKNIAQNTARTMNERLAPLRPALITIRNESPRLKEVAEKLVKIEHEFNKNASDVNKAFTEFEEIVRSEDRRKIASRASIVVPWLIAVLITAIALAGVFLNFFLIERPMAEIVGEGARIGGIGLPTFAAVIVIFLEFVTGVILMDAAGFTRLIPAFHSMSAAGRRVMLVVSFCFLALFSVMEMTLSIVREQIIEQQRETDRLAAQIIGPDLIERTQPPAEGAAPAAEAPASTAPQRANVFGLELSTFAQLILAGVIPWLLAAAALPLETIIRNSVFILSIFASFALIFLAFICKTISAVFKNVGVFVLAVYDFIIFLPLYIQRRVQARGAGADEPPTPRQKEPRQKGRKSSSDDDDAFMLSDPAQEKSPNRDKQRQPEQKLEKAS